MTITKETMTFNQFFLAMAYGMSRIRKYVEQKGIKAAFFPPLWKTCDKDPCDHCGECKKGKERAEALRSFLVEVFFAGRERPKAREIEKLADYFSVETFPAKHIRLKEEWQEEARKLLESNKEEVVRAVDSTLDTYLRHRDRDRKAGGEQEFAGFGLLLSLIVD